MYACNWVQSWAYLVQPISMFVCLFFSLSFEDNYYIGLNDIEKNGTYVWLQGTEATSFTNWHSGHPKAGTAENSRDCVTIFLKTQSENGKWKTKQCNFTFRFICACPDGPCVWHWYWHVFLSLRYPKKLNSKVQSLDKTDLPASFNE